MEQLSRPYQIAIGAVLVLALIWAVALRSHGSSSSEPAPSSPSTTPASSQTSASSEAKAAAAPTHVYHGAAPGVEGLTRAIAKAHGAVATSQQKARQLQSKSAEASQESQAPTSASKPTVQRSTGGTTTHRSSSAPRPRHPHTTSSHKGRTIQQVSVEREIKAGKTAMLVFWNPKSSVDQEVRSQALALAHGSGGVVTVHTELANQVGVFGRITEVAQVYQTPTILIVNKRGLVSTLTGLTDVFSLRQAVREARSAS
jgi:hypothetical protein